MGANWTETSTGLKLLVITMTGLLVVGLILLAVGLARTAGELGRIVAADGVPAAAARPAQSFEGEFEIEIPAGTRLRSITATDVEVSDERDPDTEIGGVISTVDEAAGTFTIGPVTVHWDGATKLRDLSELRAGVLVEATLDVSGGRLRASMVEREEDDD